MGKDEKKASKKNAEKAQENKDNVNQTEENVQDAAEEVVDQTEETSEQADEKEAEQDISAEDKLHVELAEQKDKYVRLYSEFENFRRRTAKERLDLVKTATEDLVKELLPVMDDFERAAKNNQQDGVELASVLEGYGLIQNKLVRALEGKGLKQMEIGPGSEFDTEFQEAITQIPAPEESLKGKVVDVIEPGYMLGEKVVRYAKVVTGS